MDKVGLRELLRSGVQICEEQWKSQSEDAADGLVDSRTSTVMDRLAQTGVLAAEHDQEWLWHESIEAMGHVYRLAIPDNWRGWQPPARSARWILAAAYRAYVIGAAAFVRKRFRLLRELFLFKVSDEYQDYWLRYAVTMAARAELPGAFKGKSLIGPMSHYISEKPYFASMFDGNQDALVNTLCRVDFLGCVAVVGESKDIDRAYPNFAAYYSERTMPVVKSLIRGGPEKSAIPEISNELLAEILKELNVLAREQFVMVSGWEGYDKDVYAFIKEHFTPPASPNK